MIKSNLNDAELIAAAADLATAHCELNHGPGVDTNNFPAVDMLTIPLGRKIGDSEYEEIRKLQIPVCKECAETLSDPDTEWTLLYCLDCSANRWVYRPWAKNNYRHRVLWLKGCPDCSNVFGGLYFADSEFVNAPSEDL